MPEYKISYEFDLDGDGAPEGNDEAALNDLRLKHTTHDACWLRTFLISTDLRQ